MTSMLFDDARWQAWCAKIEKDFKPKRYQHFDHRFDFPKRKEEIRRLVSDPALLASHPFLPLLKVIIKTPRYRYNDKKGKMALGIKPRPISFAGHFDTYLYAYYAHALNEVYQQYIRDAGFDQAVLAYRSDLDGQCNVQFSREAFQEIKDRGECVAIALDIKGYFDHIDHKLLKEKWCKVLEVDELPIDQYALWRSLTKYSYVNKVAFLKHFKIDIHQGTRRPTLLDYIEKGSFLDKFDTLRGVNLVARNQMHEETPEGRKRFYGIPQGSAISALLSNIYLIDYDEMISEKAKAEGFYYRRYCDDILIVCDSNRAEELQEFALKAIEAYHVQIQSKKTELIAFHPNSKGKIRAFNLRRLLDDCPGDLTADSEERYYKNLQYLGFEFNGQTSFIRTGSISRYAWKMHGRITKTVYMAYSPRAKGHKIFLQQLYHRYSHLGQRNFPRYAYNSAKPYYVNSKGVRKEGMDSPAVRKQLSKHWERMRHTLEHKNAQRVNDRNKKGKLKRIKSI